jgi:peroxiredoxin Q/BCP
MAAMERIKKMLSSLAGTAAEPITEGCALPEVTQKNQDGVCVNLADAGASGYVLVYFYPKADTPGCTKQACGLRDAFAELTGHGVKVFGVSLDSVKAQKDFQLKYSLPFDLLADEDATVLKAFGVPSTLGFAKRQAFLFKDGKLVWRDLTASTDQQAADVLGFLNVKP